MGLLSGSAVKNLICNAGDAGDTGLIPGLGSSPEEGSGNPFQYSCLENPTDRGAWRATSMGAKSWTRLNTLSPTNDTSHDIVDHEFLADFKGLKRIYLIWRNSCSNTSHSCSSLEAHGHVKDE